MNGKEIFALAVLFAVSSVAGFVMHRSDFCIAGMFRDIFLFRRTFPMKSLAILVLASMGLFQGGHLLGLLPNLPFPWYGTASLAVAAGGVVFGTGMVLAGGCVVGTLYKMGAGQTVSWVAFLGILAGSLAFIITATFWQPIGAAMAFNGGAVTVAEAISVPEWVPAAVVLPAGIMLVYRWYRSGSLHLEAHARGYIHPAITSVILAVISTLSYYLISIPPGVTTSYTKFSVWLLGLAGPGYVSGLPVLAKTVVAYDNPFTGTVITGTMGPGWDGVYFVQLPLILGIVTGSFASAATLGEFSFRFRAPARQYLGALAGGILMGYGSRMGLGCNIWHLLGGLPILALNGILFVPAVAAGAFIGSKVLTRVVVR